MTDSTYVNYAAFARREGRAVDISGMSAGLDQFNGILNNMGREAWEDSMRVVDFYNSDEYQMLIDDVYEEIEDIYDDLFTLDLYLPETIEEYYDPTDDMIWGLMYMDEMIDAKEDQLIAGFDFDYGTVEDPMDNIDYKELHAGRTTPDKDGGFYASPTGGVSIEDYLFLQDIYSAYVKKINEGEDVTELKRP